MIDHLIRAADKPTMLGLLQPLGYATVTDFGAAVILNVGGSNDESLRAILAPAVWNRSDPNPAKWTIITPEVLAPGFFVLVATEKLDTRLRDLAGNACRMIADRDQTIAKGSNVILYLAPDFDPTLEGTATLEPTPAGANYQFHS